MVPKITSEQLHLIHEEMLAEDERNRRLNRLYCAALDAKGWDTAWASWAEHERTKSTPTTEEP